MENKRKLYWVPIVVAACLAIGMLLGSILAPKPEVFSSVGESRYQKLQDIIHVLDKKYVDPIDGSALFEKTIGDMLHKLDPHSNYIPADELKAMNEVIEGKFGGVGIRFFIIRDTVCITNVLPYSPAMKAGLKSGDKLLKVDGKNVAGQKIKNEDVMAKLKGIEGTSVQLTVLRNNKRVKKSVVRGSIPVESVVAAYMIEDEIGYIKIDQFSMATAIEFRRATNILRAQGLKKLVIDLRNNGGGLLTGATEIADEFLEANIPIVETKGEHSRHYTYESTSKGNLKDVEVAILINSNSASASEILAGAIQDNDRGVIVGRRSFGKGLVQEDILLKDGSNLRLTIARYYTPTGRCIQRPYSDDVNDYYEDQLNRYDEGGLYHVDSTKFVDSLKYVTPKGKIVYGGGGIMPDIFVPYDSTGTSWYYSQLRFSTAFTTFAFDFVQGKRQNWRSPSAFEREFAVNDELLVQFAQFAEDESGVKRNAVELEVSKKLIARTLKSEIARQLWIEQGYYQVNNVDDQEVQQAVDALK